MCGTMDRVEADHAHERHVKRVRPRPMRITPERQSAAGRGSLEEIEAVMGHEMGHYVLNHIPKDRYILYAGGAGLLRLPAAGRWIGV